MSGKRVVMIISRIRAGRKMILVKKIREREWGEGVKLLELK